MLACGGCNGMKPTVEYSASQLKKKGKRKCPECITTAAAEATAAAEVPAAEEMKAPSPSPEKRTQNVKMQAQLDAWCKRIDEVDGLSPGSDEWKTGVLEFCKSFVPLDLDEDDMKHFSEGLASDAPWFTSLTSEVRVCATGVGVTKIKETSKKCTFVFPAKAGPDNLDREVTFVLAKGSWRAEG